MENLIEKYKDKLPESYLDFIDKHNGFNGDLGDELGYVILWDRKELHESWYGYNFDEFLGEKWFPIGSNGSDELIVINISSIKQALFSTPFIPMSDEEAIEYCDNFSLLFDAIKNVS